MERSGCSLLQVFKGWNLRLTWQPTKSPCTGRGTFKANLHSHPRSERSLPVPPAAWRLPPAASHPTALLTPPVGACASPPWAAKCDRTSAHREAVKPRRTPQRLGSLDICVVVYAVLCSAVYLYVGYYAMYGLLCFKYRTYVYLWNVWNVYVCIR